MKIIPYIFTTLAIAGCTSTAVTQSEVENYFEDAELLFVFIGDEIGTTPTLDMPSSGSVTYSGYTAIYDMGNASQVGSVDTRDTLIGKLSMTADFAAATLSGEASNFSEAVVAWDDYDDASTPIEEQPTWAVTVGDAASGVLELTGGVVSGFYFDELNMSGTLTTSNHEDWVVSALIDGEF